MTDETAPTEEPQPEEQEESKPEGVDRSREALDKAVKTVAAELKKQHRHDGSLDPASVADAAIEAVAPAQRDKLAGKVARSVEASAYRDDPGVAARVAVEAVARLAK